MDKRRFLQVGPRMEGLTGFCRGARASITDKVVCTALGKDSEMTKCLGICKQFGVLEVQSEKRERVLGGKGQSGEGNKKNFGGDTTELELDP